MPFLTALSPDGRHLYAAEFETDSVVSFALAQPAIGGGSTVQGGNFLDRRANGELRVRFFEVNSALNPPENQNDVDRIFRRWFTSEGR